MLTKNLDLSDIVEEGMKNQQQQSQQQQQQQQQNQIIDGESKNSR